MIVRLAHLRVGKQPWRGSMTMPATDNPTGVTALSDLDLRAKSLTQSGARSLASHESWPMQKVKVEAFDRPSIIGNALSIDQMQEVDTSLDERGLPGLLQISTPWSFHVLPQLLASQLFLRTAVWMFTKGRMSVSCKSGAMRSLFS